MIHFGVFLIFLASISQECHCVKTEYFWREYTGEIPEDAILAGKDINNKNIYIGQAYLKNVGLIVVQITPGVREVSVAYKGINKVNKYTKILCGPQEKFDWQPATSGTLHLDIIDKQLVFGGHQDEQGYIGIGRISYKGEIKVGKVVSFGPQNAQLYFDYNGKELWSRTYEVLVADGKAQSIIFREILSFVIPIPNMLIVL